MNTIEQEPLEPSNCIIEKKPVSGIDQALADIENGNVFHAENVDDLFRQLNED